MPHPHSSGSPPGMGLHQSLSSCAAAAPLFGEGVVPNSHPGPLLTQLKAINYLLSYCSFGEDASPDLAAASFQAAVGSDVVSPPPRCFLLPRPCMGVCAWQLQAAAQFLCSESLRWHLACPGGAAGSAHPPWQWRWLWAALSCHALLGGR